MSQHIDKKQHIKCNAVCLLTQLFNNNNNDNASQLMMS